MAKINNTAAYAISTTIDGSDIVIGSENGNGGDTKNFQMSDISTFVLGNAVTPTLDDVCQQGNTTTTSIQINNVGGLSILTGPLTSNGSTFLLGSSTVINGTVDINNTADISGNTTIGGTLGVTGVSTLGEIDASGVADIADTLTLSKATGNGLVVTASADIGGNLVVSGSLSVVDVATFFQNTTFNQGVILNDAAPTSPTDTGIAGEVAVDADYIYVCTATNTWKRVALAAWTP